MTHFLDLFDIRVRENAEKIALRVDDKSITYAKVDCLARRIERVFVDLNLVAGDRVAIYSKPRIEILAAVIAVLRAGCVMVTVHHTFGLGKLSTQISDAGARFLVTDREADARKAMQGSVLAGIFDVDSLTCDSPPVIESHSITTTQIDPDFDENRIGAIFYTTGSTSRPKGVAVTHKNMLAAFRSVTEYLGICESDIVLNFSTFATDYGFYSVLMPLLLGGTAVMSTTYRDGPSDILEVIERWGVTAIHIFPPILVELLKDARLQSSPSTPIRYILSSGQALPARDIQRLRAAWPAVKLFPSYGLTECKRVAYLPPSEVDSRPSSVGKAIPGVRTYLLDESEQLVTQPNAVGELAVAGDLVMTGYWNMPDENARRFRYGIHGEARMFLTGDMFRMDADGYLYYVSRKDDVFSRNMFKVNPREVEQHILKLPEVAEVAVVPVPDEAEGQIPKACVVLLPGARLSAEQILRHCAAELDWQMIPAIVAFYDCLPRSESGKTSNRALQQAISATIFQGDNNAARQSVQ